MPQVRSAAVLGKRVRIRALKMGFYNNERRRVGDVFMAKAEAFNPSWMEPVDGAVPIQRTTGKDELRRKHDELLSAKMGQAVHTDEHDVPTGTDNPLDAEE